jgi:hypothetical protein
LAPDFKVPGGSAVKILIKSGETTLTITFESTQKYMAISKIVKMKKIRTLMFATLSLATVLLTSCGGIGSNTTADSKIADVVEEMAATKSYMIEYKTTVNAPEMKSTAATTTWIDNTNDRQAVFTDTESEVMGRKQGGKSLMIMKDGWSYMIDLTQKTGFKTKEDAIEDSSMDMMETEDDVTFRQMIESEGGKIVGNEQFLGRDCIVVEMNDEGETGDPMLTKIWYYKGILLKMTNAITTMEATRFEENISISSDKFEVPGDIIISDLPSFK